MRTSERWTRLPEAPEPSIGTEWRLTDLIDVRTLQAIQDTFARAFGLPTVIVHPDGSNATDITNRVTFCEDLTRTSPVGGPRCADCDLRAMHKAQRQGEPAIFKCWNGLYDCAIPISCKGQTLGYFLCGQILIEAPDLARYRETAREIGTNPEAYLDAITDVRRVDFAAYEASVHSMHVLATMIAEQAAAAIDSLAMLEEAEQARADAGRLLGELDGILDGLQQVGSQPDYQATLQAVAEVLQRLIPWDSCVIYLLDAEHEELVPVVVRDPYPDQMEHFRPRLGQSIAGRVAVTGIGRRLSDVTEDPDFEAIPGVPLEPEAMLAVPMVYRDSVSGVIVLSRFERRTFTEHDLGVLLAFSSQASSSIQLAKLASDNARRVEDHRQLSELGTELTHAPNTTQLEGRLLQRARGIFAGDVAWLATLSGGPDDIEVTILDGGRPQRLSIGLEGPARVAALRLRDDPACARSVFDSWAQEVYAEVAARANLTSYIAEPLAISTGALGGLFIGWRDGTRVTAVERTQMLGLVASAAGASLARLSAYQQTDATLRERVADLEGLTQLAQRLTALREVPSIVDEILQAFQRLGGLEGAVYVRIAGGEPEVSQASGLSRSRVSELLRAYETAELDVGGGWVALAQAGGEAIFLPGARAGVQEAFFAGVGARRDPDRNRLLQMIARYGAVALENAELHQRQQLAIARLQQKNDEIAEQTVKLERILSVHETLAGAVLTGQGLASVAASLGAFIGGDLTIVTSDDRILASWPPGTTIRWRPPQGAAAAHALEEPSDDGQHLLAAPAVVEGEQFGWVLSRLHDPPDDVARASVEYGALLTALELLRERTATEVESRLRGGLLDELFGEEFVPELIEKQAMALGLDLQRSSRVYLAEAMTRQGTEAHAPVDPERLVKTVARVAGEADAGSLVALRGTAVVAIVPEDERAQRFEERLHDELGQRYPELACSVAAGTLCLSAFDYRRSFLAARRGLDLLRLQHRHDHAFSFRDTTVVTMLLQATEPEVIVDFIARYVEPLDRYDAGHSSELRRTAETLFHTNSNLEETARRLHVHVSTLRYRLGRISEILGIDLKDRRALLDLQVALEAAEPMAVHPGVSTQRGSAGGEKARAGDRKGHP
jgi:ligand-binding sensor protein/sugar diacid utilization regulator/GAF domain-containing protein